MIDGRGQLRRSLHPYAGASTNETSLALPDCSRNTVLDTFHGIPDVLNASSARTELTPNISSGMSGQSLICTLVDYVEFAQTRLQ